jgi:hypothetical protein
MCGLASAGVIGPISFLEKRREVVLCFDVPENCAVPQVPDGYVSQQDGAPPPLWTPDNELLGEQFTGIWICRGGSISLPHRSPDLTPLTICYGNRRRVSDQSQ